MQCLHNIFENLMLRYIFLYLVAEDIDGKCLFDMYKCELNGLDLGLLALERFCDQLQFKSLLNELFISENVTKAAPEVTLSAIQKRVLLTK